MKKNEKNKKRAAAVALAGMLFALACVMSLLENLIMISTMPGIKLGLANIVVMYALFFIGKKYALLLVLLKAAFNAAVMGVTAGAISLSGGLISLAAIILTMTLTKNKASYLFLSVIGAVFHNMGQLLVAAALLRFSITLYYAPVLIIAGIVVGALTAGVLKIIMPALAKLNIATKTENK